MAFWDKRLIIPLETDFDNWLKWILAYEKNNSYLFTDPCIGVGFECKLSLYL